MDLATPADHRVKLKESKTRDKYLDLARELKNYGTVTQIVSGGLGTVTKGLLQGLEGLEIKGRLQTIQTTALLRSVKILRRVLETCCHSYSSGKPSANADGKNYQMSKRKNK